jgi:hypothetical protein
MKKQLLIAILVGLLIPAIASAGGKWRSGYDGSGSEILSISPTNAGGGGVAYYTFSDTTDSNLIDVSACENWSLMFISDITGNDYNSTIKVGTCITGSAGASPTTALCAYQYNTAGAVSLTGNPATGLHKIFGASDYLLYIDVTANSDPNTSVAMLKCN